MAQAMCNTVLPMDTAIGWAQKRGMPTKIYPQSLVSMTI